MHVNAHVYMFGSMCDCVYVCDYVFIQILCLSRISVMAGPVNLHQIS